MTMKYAKAYVGTAVAFLTAVGTGLTDGVLTPAEWVTAAVAGLVAFGAVAGIPNAPTA